MAKVLTIPTAFTAIDKFTAPVTRMGAAAKSFANKAGTAFAKVDRSARKINDTLGKTVGKFGAVTGVLAALSLGAAVSEGSAAIVDFDKNLTSAAAKFGLFDRASASFNVIKQAAKEVGATTMFTAGQAAEGLNFLAMAGFDASRAVASLPTVVNLAVASETDLGTATDIATDTLGAMGLASKNAATQQRNLIRVSDVLVKTTTTANTTMALMFETVKGAGPTFTNAGGTLEEFAAITGIMANSGIKGERAGTALKNMVVNLQAPTAKQSKLLKKMTVDIDDGTGKMKRMPAIIGEIIAKTNSWTSIQRNAAFATLFGKEAISGATITMNAGADSIGAYVKELQGAEGTSARMTKFIGTSFAGSLATMKSSFESIAITLGEVFAPEIDYAIKRVTTMAKGAKVWLTSNKQLIKDVASAALWVGKIVIAVKAYTMVVQAAALAQTLLNLTNPVGWITIAVGLIAVLAYKWELVKSVLKEVAKPLLVLPKMFSDIGESWRKVTNAFSAGGMLAGIKAIGSAVLDSIVKPLESVYNIITQVLKFASIFGAVSWYKAIKGEVGLGNDAAVNTQATTERIRTERSEKVRTNRSTLEITGPQQYVNLQSNDDAIQFTPTFGF